MTSFTILFAGKMPPKLTAAERAQFRAEAKNAAASEIRSKKRHSMNAAATTSAVIVPSPPGLPLKLKIPIQPKKRERKKLLS